MLSRHRVAQRNDFALVREIELRISSHQCSYLFYDFRIDL